MATARASSSGPRLESEAIIDERLIDPRDDPRGRRPNQAYDSLLGDWRRLREIHDSLLGRELVIQPYVTIEAVGGYDENEWIRDIPSGGRPFYLIVWLDPIPQPNFLEQHLFEPDQVHVTLAKGYSGNRAFSRAETSNLVAIFQRITSTWVAGQRPLWSLVPPPWIGSFNFGVPEKYVPMLLAMTALFKSQMEFIDNRITWRADRELDVSWR